MTKFQTTVTIGKIKPNKPIYTFFSEGKNHKRKGFLSHIHLPEGKSGCSWGWHLHYYSPESEIPTDTLENILLYINSNADVSEVAYNHLTITTEFPDRSYNICVISKRTSQTVGLVYGKRGFTHTTWSCYGAKRFSFNEAQKFIKRYEVYPYNFEIQKIKEDIK